MRRYDGRMGAALVWFWVVVLWPVLPGILMMFLAAVRGPGRQSVRLMITGAIMLIAGAVFSVFLHNLFA